MGHGHPFQLAKLGGRMPDALPVGRAPHEELLLAAIDPVHRSLAIADEAVIAEEALARREDLGQDAVALEAPDPAHPRSRPSIVPVVLAIQVVLGIHAEL